MTNYKSEEKGQKNTLRLMSSILKHSNFLLINSYLNRMTLTLDIGFFPNRIKTPTFTSEQNSNKVMQD